MGDDAGEHGDTKVVASYAPCVPAVAIVRKDVEDSVVRRLETTFLESMPPWTDVYGAFRRYAYADVQTFYRALGELPVQLL